MDTGSKTLTQLSEEDKETKYISIETGSKISGYTKDYLERLCRLNKVEYKMWLNGKFAIELKSLLRETHAILLSNEGVTFVEKSELLDPPPPVGGDRLSSALKEVTTTVAPQFQTSEVISSPPLPPSPPSINTTQSVPHFGETDASRNTPFSFVGRAVVSDALHPEEKKVLTETKLPKTPKVEVPIIKKADESQVKEQPSVATHVPIAKLNLSAIQENSSAPIPIKDVTEKVGGSIPIVVENSPKDDWDSLLLGKTDDVVVTAPIHVAIVKEVDGRIVESTNIVPEISAPVPSTELAQQLSSDPKESDIKSSVPPQGQKIVVFSNNIEIPPILQPEEKEIDIPSLPAINTMSNVLTTAPVVPLPMTIESKLPMQPNPPEIPKPKEELIPTPNISLAKNEEHHLTPYEMHPLMKSTGFNVVFGIMLIATTFLTLGGNIIDDVGDTINPTQYVAGVGALGASLPPEVPTVLKSTERSTLQKGTRAMLPFSSEITATSGPKANSIIVRPILENGPGNSYEYILVPEGDTVSSDNR